MAAAQARSIGELLDCVVSSRLEQPIAAFAAAEIGLNQRLLDERQQEISDRSRWRFLAGSDGDDRGERGAAEENRQAGDQRLLRLAEQPVTPVDQRMQRLLTR